MNTPSRPRTLDGRPFPLSLKLEFSRAADAPKIQTVFHPEIKKHADPDGHVALRDEAMVRDHLIHGRAAMITDDTGFVNTLTVAWHLIDREKPKPVHRYTEVGTSITFIPGYNSARVVIAAATLRDWWLSPPANQIVTEITKDNLSSQKAYRDHLHWQEIKSKTALKDVIRLSYASVADYDCAGSPSHWFRVSEKTIRQNAAVLLLYMSMGELRSKTGPAIPLDLTALEECGLTRARLVAMAQGETSRRTLRAIAPAL